MGFSRHAETHRTTGRSLPLTHVSPGHSSPIDGLAGAISKENADAPRRSGDVRLPHVDDLHPDIATFMIARAFAEVYRDELEQPVPAVLAAILRKTEPREVDHGCHAA